MLCLQPIFVPLYYQFGLIYTLFYIYIDNELSKTGLRILLALLVEEL